MAFVCTVNDEIEIGISREGGESAASVAVGYDPDKNVDYTVITGFSPAGGGSLEYYFTLVESDNATDSEYFYWDGKLVSRFISKEDRRLILGVILAATRLITRELQPQSFFRVTHEPHLPDEALEKHELITQVFGECGYTARRADPYHGKRTWVMERASDAIVASDEEGRYDEGSGAGEEDHGPPKAD